MVVYNLLGAFLYLHLPGVLRILYSQSPGARGGTPLIVDRCVPREVLRTNVTNRQTFGGNSSNIDFVHILQLDRP